MRKVNTTTRSFLPTGAEAPHESRRHRRRRSCTFRRPRELAAADVLVKHTGGDAGYLSLEDQQNPRQLPPARRRHRQPSRCPVRTQSGAVRRIRRRRQETRRGQLHARSGRAVHGRRYGASDHAGLQRFHDQGRSVLQHDLVEDAGDPRARDGSHGQNAERWHARRRSRAADLDV